MKHSVVSTRSFQAADIIVFHLCKPTGSRDVCSAGIDQAASYRSCEPSSFMTVSALSPTLAIAASISALDFLRPLHQLRARSLLDKSTRFRSFLATEVVSMSDDPCDHRTSVEM